MLNKGAAAVILAFSRIFNKTSRRSLRVQSDKGREFVNGSLRRFFKKHYIDFNTIKSPDIKCSIVERVIKTLKEKIFKYIYYKRSYRYIDVLQAIASSYNNSFHRSIRMAHSAVNERNILEVYKNLRKEKKQVTHPPKCKINDYVRIYKYKGVFDKGYYPNWSDEIFKIKSVSLSSPVVYKIVDLLDEDIESCFYEQEIQKVIFDEQTSFAIEKIIDQRRIGNSLQLSVKWRGYPEKFSSWIDSSVLEQ